MPELENLETRFEITSIATKDSVGDLIWMLMKRRKGAWIKMGLLCILAIGYAIYLLHRGLGSMAALSLCIAFILPIRIAISFRRQTRALYETSIRMKPDMKRYSTFSDDSFSLNGTVPSSYSQPSTITEDARYFYLFFGNTPLQLDKSGFIKGDPKDFLLFVQKRIAEANLPEDEPAL